jgi:ribosomal protein S18 acetylase RimI-like enzyme
MSTPSVTTATLADRDTAIGVLVLAFGADPMARWCWSDPQEYLATFPRFVQAFAGEAFVKGTAWCTDGGAGTALWLPPNAQPDEEVLGALMESTLSGQRRDDVFAILEQMGSHHPSESHWYLPLIGVDPAHQGKGYGAALMQHALAICDRDHLPAYLESTNPRNVSLYERHGFEVVATIRAGSSPPMHPMLRAAR